MEGGQGAERELFDALTARFRLVAAKRIWNEEDAEEIVQDALVIVHTKYRESVLKSSFTEWAHKVLQNKMLEYYRTTSRRNARFVLSEDVDRYASQLEGDPDLVIRLKKCVRKVIGANQRYARILIHVYQGYSAHEISTRLGLTKANFYSQLSRARSLLRRCLDKGDI